MGGKARTQPVAGTGRDGRHDLPGEHGFRFYPRFYRHVIDVMERIPVPNSPAGHVASQLRTCNEAAVASINGQPCFPFQRRALRRPSDILDTLELYFQELGFDTADAGLFGLKFLQFLSSSDDRRLGEYERMSWWDFIGGDGFSPKFRKQFSEVPRMLVAMDAKKGNARTTGVISMQLVLDFACDGEGSDRTMGGPTTEMWIDPWISYLKKLGVQFHPGETCVALDVAGVRIDGTRFASGTVAKGDHYVLAVPLEVAKDLMSDDLASLDPQCDRLRDVNINELVSWMVGIQFYLREDVPLVRGHLFFPDSPWALTAISQAQFWRETLGLFRQHYGNGEVGGLISVDISEWNKPGTFIKKKANECSKDEIEAEVWWQLKAALNGSRPDQQILTDDLLHSCHLDDDIDYSSGVPPRNHSPLLIHPPGSWALRPEAASAIPNLCFAADYVRTYTDLASMEAACEAGRRATNAILDRANSPAARIQIRPLEEPPMFEPWKNLDADLYRVGRPHIFEILGVKHAYEAADLFRRFTAFSSLGHIETLISQFKVKEIVGGFFKQFGIGG
jgi:uncharacterized protein with NAD-binding domain and iron-sulfur cluster